MSRNVMKRTFQHVRSMKIRIRANGSEPSWGAVRIAKDANVLHTNNKDFNQAARMRRLIWLFVGRTCQKVRFLSLRII